MIDALEYSFDGEIEPGHVTAEEVAERLDRTTLSRSSRVDQALATLDELSADLVEADVSAVLQRYHEEAAPLFGLHLRHEPKLRIRFAVGMAHRRAWEYSAKISRRLEELAHVEDFDQASLMMWQLHIVLRRKFRGDPDKLAALNEKMLGYYSILGPSALDVGDVSLTDLMGETGAGLGRVQTAEGAWSHYLDQVGLNPMHPLHQQAWQLADLSDESSLALVEERAARFPDQSIVAALRKMLAPRLKAVALRRHRSGIRTSKFAANAGIIEMDAVDFFVLQLAELYAVCFGRSVPTYFDNRPRREGHKDKHFADFLGAAAIACGVQVGSLETRIRKWRSLSIIREHLRSLATLSDKADDTFLPAATIDERPVLVTTWVLANAPMARWAGG